MVGGTPHVSSRRFVRAAGFILIGVLLGSLVSQLTARSFVGPSIRPTAYLSDGAIVGAVLGTILASFHRSWKAVIGLGFAGLLLFALVYHWFLLALLGI
ncbi:hypothetical protein [Luteolibacter sp. Populi]|uniref:hypothetical protein n=1 Tax=Luteolibacter sp. Populi TaxID=3230487 RepID=UPI0034662C71